MSKVKSIGKVYLDYASTTPVDPRVSKAMEPYISHKFGNAGSLHSYGQEAIAALDKSRENIAKSIGANFNEIIFTSSATEANNLALRGLMSSVKCQVSNVRPRIIISAIEHESILETARDLERNGVEVIYLPVDKNGFVALGQLKKALNGNTILVSIMYANNEIGTIQPISAIAEVIRNWKLENKKQGAANYKLQVASYPLFHTDAVQAFQYLNCNVDDLGVDMMTLSSHKIYGPKGAGALYARDLSLKANSYKLKAILTGGGQEFGLRSSTENIPAIVGFAKAVELVSNFRQRRTSASWTNSRELENGRVGALRNYLWKKLKSVFSRAELNGSLKERLPNNLNIYIPNVRAEEFLIKLDLAGIAASSGSACASRSQEPSHVIKALGFGDKRALGSVRMTLGRFTKKADIDKIIRRFKIIAKKAPKNYAKQQK